MGKNDFAHHVNAQRNDFAAWIRQVIGDKDLAKSLGKIKTKAALAKKVSERVKALKKA